MPCTITGECLAVDDRRAVDRRVERIGVRDVVRIPAAPQTDDHDQDEAAERDERDAVARRRRRASAHGLRPTTRASPASPATATSDTGVARAPAYCTHAWSRIM